VILPRQTGCEDDFLYETLGLEKRKPPVPNARFPHNGCGLISILLGRLVGVPEAYWAAIATVMVMQSPLGATVPLAIERIVARALGASMGAIESSYFGPNLFVFALAMLLLGLISFVLRLEKVGYSYACITLVIIVLIPRADTPPG
jgi:uncharacterized membrane protein YccC